MRQVKGLTQKAGPTEPQGTGGAAQQFKNSLSGAAITDNSPAKQLADVSHLSTTTRLSVGNLSEPCVYAGMFGYRQGSERF